MVHHGEHNADYNLARLNHPRMCCVHSTTIRSFSSHIGVSDLDVDSASDLYTIPDLYPVSDLYLLSDADCHPDRDCQVNGYIDDGDRYVSHDADTDRYTAAHPLT